MGEFQPVLKQKHKQERRQEDKCADSTIYEQNIGKLVPIVKEQRGELVGEPSVIEAIKQTTKYDGRSFSYLEKVLQEWIEANLATLDAVHAYESRKSSQFHSESRRKIVNNLNSMNYERGMVNG